MAGAHKLLKEAITTWSVWGVGQSLPVSLSNFVIKPGLPAKVTSFVSGWFHKDKILLSSPSQPLIWLPVFDMQPYHLTSLLSLRAHYEPRPFIDANNSASKRDIPLFPGAHILVDISFGGFCDNTLLTSSFLTMLAASSQSPSRLFFCYCP